MPPVPVFYDENPFATLNASGTPSGCFSLCDECNPLCYHVWSFSTSSVTPLSLALWGLSKAMYHGASSFPADTHQWCAQWHPIHLPWQGAYRWKGQWLVCYTTAPLGGEWWDHMQGLQANTSSQSSVFFKLELEELWAERSGNWELMSVIDLDLGTWHVLSPEERKNK